MDKPTNNEMQNAVSWGTRTRPDALTADEAEVAADAIVDWLRATTQPLVDARPILRAVQSTGEVEGSLFELAVTAAEPLSEAARTELLAVRDLTVIIRGLHDAVETDGAQVTSRAQDWTMNEPTLQRAIEMVNDDCEFIEVVRMMAGTAS